jgi:hypothetical protein
MYHDCVNISRIVVSAELTCDDGVVEEISGVEEGSSVKETNLSNQPSVQTIIPALLEPDSPDMRSFMNCTLLSNMQTNKSLTCLYPSRESQSTTIASKKVASNKMTDIISDLTTTV